MVLKSGHGRIYRIMQMGIFYIQTLFSLSISFPRLYAFMFIYYVIACPELWKKSVGRNGYNDFCMFLPVFAASRSPNIQYYSIEVIKNNSGIYIFYCSFLPRFNGTSHYFSLTLKSTSRFHCFSFFHMFIIILYNRINSLPLLSRASVSILCSLPLLFYSVIFLIY